MTSPIFYVTELSTNAQEVPFTFLLEGDEAHHALKVKRLNIGEGILISDGQGTKYQGIVKSIEADSLVAELTQKVEDSTNFDLILVQALAKSERDLLAIEMATELGITEVVPWESDRSIVRWKGSRAQKSHLKWENTVRAAAKQARRALIPSVNDLVSSKKLSEEINCWVREGKKVLILHEDAHLKLASALTDESNGFVFVVGPEGGISPHELELFESAGAYVIGLGHEVLRSSTAGAAVLSAINYSTGRWS